MPWRNYVNLELFVRDTREPPDVGMAHEVQNQSLSDEAVKIHSIIRMVQIVNGSDLFIPVNGAVI
jgi:hypothetical protein